MEETVSEISSAIKRLIETWLKGEPPKIVHNESTEPVGHDQSPDEPNVTRKQSDIDARQNETSDFQKEPKLLGQLPQLELLTEKKVPPPYQGQPPHAEGEGPGRWIIGIGNWLWLADKPTDPPEGETYETGKWDFDLRSEQWMWISL
jgi:hypothetical protein